MFEPAAENVGVSRDINLNVRPLPFSNAPTASKQSHLQIIEMGTSKHFTKNGHITKVR